MYSLCHRYVKEIFCRGCGACFAVCSRQAIHPITKNGRYLFQKDIKKCSHCSLCTKVCPSNPFDFNPINQKISKHQSQDLFLGHYLKCYVGHSANPQIRYQASSGGIANTLLLSLLETKQIDGAIVTKMDDTLPLKPKVFIAKTKEEIISAKGSKYCPVSLNTIFNNIQDLPQKLAVVGLPCHIQALRKMEIWQKGLKEKIILRIGLFCANTINFKGTEFLLKKIFKIKPGDISKIEYRSKGWPGGMTLKLKNGQKKFFPASLYQKYLFLPPFIPPACYFCTDTTNELADLSLGDAWLPEYVSEKKGKSIIITRTKNGEELLHAIIKKNELKIETLEAKRIYEAQHAPLYFKKIRLKGRLALIKPLCQKKSEQKNLSLLDKPRLSDYFAAIFSYFNIFFSLNPIFQKIISLFPPPLLKLYRLLFGLINYTTVSDLKHKININVNKYK